MRDPFEQLHRIQDALVKIESYVKHGRRRFENEEEIQISLIHYLQVISDATNAISPVFKDHHPELPWQQMSELQHFFTHYYLALDKDALWKIVEQTLPALKLQIDAELALEERNTEQSKTVQRRIVDHEITEGINTLLQTKREDILRTAMRYGAYNIRVFGSVVRGEADIKSDIDLLVDIEPGRTLFDLENLLIDLQSLLGKDVDVVTEKGLRGRIRERVLKDAVPL